MEIETKQEFSPGLKEATTCANSNTHLMHTLHVYTEQLTNFTNTFLTRLSSRASPSQPS